MTIVRRRRDGDPRFRSAPQRSLRHASPAPDSMVAMPSRAAAECSAAELTRTVLGEALSLGDAYDRLIGNASRSPDARTASATLRVWSIGYERYKQNHEFAARLHSAGVERLVDVRELPISRRRGYAKTAL